MKPYQIVWVAMIVLCAVAGWRLLFSTSAMVEEGRKNYGRYKLLRVLPTARFVWKSWYPTYLRCEGVCLWLLAAFFLYVVLTRH